MTFYKVLGISYTNICKYFQWMLIWLIYPLNHYHDMMVQWMYYNINKYSTWTILIFIHIWYDCTTKNTWWKNPELLTTWGKNYPQYLLCVSILYCTQHQYHKVINTINLTSPSIDLFSLQLFYHLDVYTQYVYHLSY